MTYVFTVLLGITGERGGIKLIRVGLVSAPYGEGPQVMMPLGLMCIGGYLHENLFFKKDIKIFDFSDADPEDSKPLDKIVQWRPHCIGVSIYSSNIGVIVTWVKLLRDMLPETIFCAGGPHVSIDAEGFAKDWGDIFHYVIPGDGEIPMAQVITLINQKKLKTTTADKYLSQINGTHYLSQNGKVYINNKNLQLNSSLWGNPFVSPVISSSERELLFTDVHDNKVRKSIALTSSRGCPLQCSFCAIIQAEKGGLSWRSVEIDTLMKWLQYAYSKNEFFHVYLMDANFFVKPERALDFSRKLKSMFDGKVTWSTSSTVGYLLKSKKYLKEMANNGLRLIELGIESGSEKQLVYLNKMVTIEKNIEAVKLLQKHKIQIGLDFIMFYPFQSKNEIKENLIFLRNAKLTQQEIFDHYFNMLMLYPKTKVREDAEYRLQVEFDRNALPDSADLIQDSEVRRIYHIFINEFSKTYLKRIELAINRLKSKNNPIARLYIVLLRHIPFKVLWRLVESSDLRSLKEAIPDFAEIISPLIDNENIDCTLEIDLTEKLDFNSQGTLENTQWQVDGKCYEY